MSRFQPDLFTRCRHCGKPVSARSHYCSPKCRKDGHLARRTAQKLGETVRTTGVPKKRAKSTPQVVDFIGAKERLFPGVALVFEQINDVTLKVTDGELEPVPKAVGKWPAIKTPRALAWVHGVGWTGNRNGRPTAWVASMGRSRFGPCALDEAKDAALRFAAGVRVAGRRQTSMPIERLHRNEINVSEARP
jgi:hypothetical protein